MHIRLTRWQLTMGIDISSCMEECEGGGAVASLEKHLEDSIQNNEMLQGRIRDLEKKEAHDAMMVGMMRRENAELQQSILSSSANGAAKTTAPVSALSQDSQLETLARERANLQAENADLQKKIADAQAKANTADATVTSLQVQFVGPPGNACLLRRHPGVPTPPHTRPLPTGACPLPAGAILLPF